MKIAENDYNLKRLHLSTRAYNALIRAGITDITILKDLTFIDLINLRNIGRKSVDEILHCINEFNSRPFENFEQLANCDDNPIFYIGVDGRMYQDVEIEKLGLSVRAVNCLKSAGINVYSQIVEKSIEELRLIPKMGIKSQNEIKELCKTFIPKSLKLESSPESLDLIRVKQTLLNSINEKASIKAIDFYYSFDEAYSDYIKLYTFISFDDLLKNEIFTNMLYNTKVLKTAINKLLFESIKKFSFGCDKEYLLGTLPIYFNSYQNLHDSLRELLQSNKIEFGIDEKYVVVYKSITIGISDYLDKRESSVIIQRIEGKTLEEIGIGMGLTREGVRQIEAKSIIKLNKHDIRFIEDKYRYIYIKYDISRTDFQIAFGDDFIYNYLSIRYGVNLGRSSSVKLPLDEIITDKDVPNSIKKACEKAIHKNDIYIGNEYVHCSKSSITNYLIKTYAKADLCYDQFCDIYFNFLRNIDKLNDTRLSSMERGYENKLANSKLVLWKFGKKFRYYNMDSFDFTELFEVLDLYQYDNIEYSTLKFVRLYPELMRDYDIRDEYELHNLLKKICTKELFPNIRFNRMPNIEFGSASRDRQVHELLLSLSPITNFDFAQEYEREFGVLAETVLANYMSNFDKYFYNGVYRLDSPQLPEEVRYDVKKVLDKEFYLLHDISSILLHHFPKIDKELVNPFSLKNIGFKVYSSYAIVDRYNSATDYFNKILTNNDLINLDELSANLKGIISFTNQLYKLKSEYEIIEFSPNRFINGRKILEIGVTKEMLHDYCNDVFNFIGTGQYFTLYSLKKQGFNHDLDELGFDDWFYTSILIEQKKLFSFIKIGGNKIILSGESTASISDFIESILYTQDTLSIYVDELAIFLREQFNININITRLIQIVRDSMLYFDPITEKVYADYDVYYEEV